GLPNNDAIVAVRVDESGAVNYERSSSGEPGVVSDHWAPQIDTGLVAAPGTGAFDHFLRLLLGPTRGEAGPRAVEQGAN
ncbi:MAG: hypothetical protein HKO59_06225, partial [Phycisphaerales bacterium]|nr:hypothetical protein [Phycisphaerales bacterium]